MDATTTGIVMIAAAVLVGGATAVRFRDRAGAPVAVVLFAASGVAAGTGALLLQEPIPDLLNWSVTVLFLAVVTPVHMFLVLGPARQEPARDRA
jgi:hypothetical protein